MLEHGLFHRGLVPRDGFRLLVPAEAAAKLGVIRAYADKHARDEERFRHAGFKIRRRLEALARRLGEAVEVEAVVPVRAADQRQSVRAEVLHRIMEAAAQVLHQRLGLALVVVKRHLLRENPDIARLLDVGRHAENQPERIVVEAGTHVEIAALGQRLILMIGAAIRELRRRDIQNPLAGARGNQVHKAEQILRGIAEAHAAADAGFIIAGRARHVEGHHALILVPEVDHAVEPRLAAVHPVDGEQLVPVFRQRVKRRVKLRFAFKRFQQRIGGRFVDDVRRGKLFRLRVFAIAQHKDETRALARFQRDAQMVAADGRPAAGDAVAASVFKHGARLAKAVVRAEEALAVGVEAVHRRVDRVHGKMVAALAVFRLVIDRAALDLDLAGGEVALEVGRVVLRVPQAELDEAEQRNLLRRVGAVGQLDLGDQRVHTARHHRDFHRLKAVLFARDAGIAEAVAALIAIQRRFDRHEPRRPDHAAVVDVEILPARVGRHIVVAVAGQAQHARVLVEAVAAARVAHQGEERFAAQIIDPGRRRLRLGDDVFPRRVVKIAVLHEVSSFLWMHRNGMSSADAKSVS